MSARLLNETVQIIALRQDSADPDLWVPMSDWIPTAGVCEFRAMVQLVDPSSSRVRVKPGWQVALTDASDSADVSAASAVDLVYQGGVAVTSSPSGISSGYANTEGRFLCDWTGIRGTTSATPGARVNGTDLSFRVRFGVFVRVDDASPQFDRVEVHLTPAVRDGGS